ncbi:MAG: cytochrome c [Halieaceae bacterium]|jgi:cytochrome c553|nr:cytochrome c [Halieaceae bacterium]
MRTVFALLLALAGGLAAAGELNPQRAQFNYQMACQGCHAPDGSGANAVPRMRDQVGIFLVTQAGREYLVRVPGSAVSALSDADLAEVLNWIVLEFAGASVTEPFRPYTPQEVGRLRQHPLNEVVQYRAQLLADIASANSGE